MTLSRLRRLLGRHPRARLLRVLAALTACLALAGPAGASTNLSPPSLTTPAVLGSTLVGAPGAWSGSPDFASMDLYRCARPDCADAVLIESKGIGYPSTYAFTKPLELGAYYRAVVAVHEPQVGWSTGAASAVVGPVLPHPPAATAAPTVSPWPQDGADAAAAPGAWSNGGAPGEPAIALRWQRCDAAGSGCADVAGATAATYRPGPADVGRRLRVVASASNDGGSTVAASAPSDPVAPRNTILPALHGTAADGQVLAADPGAWNGVAGLDLAYTWERCSAAGTACAPIAGAAEPTYAAGPSDVGATLRAVVRASAGASAATAAPTPATAPVAPRATADPAITGTARDGATLTATSGGWNGATGLAFAYRWLRCDAAGDLCVDLASATSASYAAGVADVGTTLRVRVTADANGGRTSSVSAPTPVVAPRLPEAVDPPVVSGVPRDGATLTTTTGGWLGTAPLDLARQWLRCDAAGGTCLAIPGATGATYDVADADVGSRLRVRVTAANAGGAAAALSAPTAEIAALAPAASAPPAVAGQPVDGGTLTATDGVWSGTRPLALARQWLRCDADGAGCVAIAGAGQATLVLDGADVGHTLRVRVTATNAAGSASDTSTPSVMIASTAPHNVTLPEVAGDPIVGATLTVTPGTWDRSGLTLTYQWQRCSGSGDACVDLAADTAATHVAVAGDVGHRLRVRVTAVGAGGTATATSSPTTAVRAAAPDPPAPPTEPRDGADGRDGRDGRDAPPAATPEAPLPLTVTASFDRPVVVGAAAAVVRGRVAGPDVAGRTVEVQLRHAFGGRTAVARGVVGPHGAFAIAVRPRVASVAAVAVLGADGAVLARMTTAPIGVRPVLRATVSRGHGGLRLAGTLVPGGGPAVRLAWQMRTSPSAAWQTVCRPLTVDRAGRFAARCGAGLPTGRAQHRVAYVAQPGGPYVAAASPAVRAGR